jgi:hypothetical protein
MRGSAGRSTEIYEVAVRWFGSSAAGNVGNAREITRRCLQRRRLVTRRRLAGGMVGFGSSADGGRRFLHPRNLVPRMLCRFAKTGRCCSYAEQAVGLWSAWSGARRSESKAGSGDRRQAVDGKMPSEPKNYAAIAMAPQFLAPCPHIALPSGEGSGLLQRALLQKMLRCSKKCFIVVSVRNGILVCSILLLFPAPIGAACAFFNCNDHNGERSRNGNSNFLIFTKATGSEVTPFCIGTF